MPLIYCLCAIDFVYFFPLFYYIVEYWINILNWIIMCSLDIYNAIQKSNLVERECQAGQLSIPFNLLYMYDVRIAEQKIEFSHNRLHERCACDE